MASTAAVVLGLDVGTTSAKAVALDAAGELVASGESPPLTTLSRSAGASEQDPAEIWLAAVTAMTDALDQIPTSAEVAAMAIAAQSGSVIPLGPDGSPAPAITWMDTRSRALVEAWNDSTQRLIREVSGWQASPGLGLATISWLRSQPHADQLTGYRSVDDHLVGRLIGQPTTNPSNAAGMQLMDVSGLVWSTELCDIAGIKPSALSPIGRSGEVVGALTPASVQALGLGGGAALVLGGHDQACATLGLGTTDPGSITISTGTAWVLTAMTDRSTTADLPESLNLSPHVAPDRWSASKNLGGLGAVIGWVIDDTSISPRELDVQLAGATDSPDAAYFLPSLHDQNRVQWGRFWSASDDPSGPARVRAVFEACAFEVRIAMEEAGTFAAPATPVTLVGGGTRTAYLTQLIANTIGRPLLVRPDASWPAIGAARLAASGIGWPPPTRATDTGTRVEPQPGPLELVESRYQTYRTLREKAG